MCGIAGVIERDSGPAGTDKVRTMTAMLAHRGPDGSGHVDLPSAALGHTRLSIIDLAGGRQPMSNEDGSVWVTFNGEIYNFRELRSRLEACGHRFRSRSDTEVLVHGWEQWGREMVGQLRGMFAFAIVDMGQRRVLLARDPFGIKPLVYAVSPRRLAFASEIRPLVAAWDDVTLDHDAVQQYFALGYIPAPATIFKEIRKLEPGHVLELSLASGRCDTSRYWRLGPWQNRADSSQAVAECEEILDESVKAHLVADVPFGAFLSGGVDSSLVVAAMARHTSPLHTFSIGFEQAQYNELPFARQVANRFGTIHHEEVVTDSVADLVPELVRHYGEPFADSSAIPTYYVSRLARTHVPMVLSGDGADELFGGYGRYQWFRSRLDARKRRGWKRTVRQLIGRAVSNRPAANGDVGSSGFDWTAFMPLLDSGMRADLLRPEVLADATGLIPAFSDAVSSIENPMDARAAQWVDFHTYLPGDVLTKVDIASMMNGLEVRTPFLDLHVARFATGLPVDLGLGPGATDRYAGKAVLRRLLSGRMGEEFATRPKTGFSVPLNDWFRNGSALDGLFRDLVLTSPRTVSMLRTTAVRDLHTRHAAGENHGSALWAILVLESWMRDVERRPDLSVGERLGMAYPANASMDARLA